METLQIANIEDGTAEMLKPSMWSFFWVHTKHVQPTNSVEDEEAWEVESFKSLQWKAFLTSIWHNG